MAGEDRELPGSEPVAPALAAELRTLARMVEHEHELASLASHVSAALVAVSAVLDRMTEAVAALRTVDLMTDVQLDDVVSKLDTLTNRSELMWVHQENLIVRMAAVESAIGNIDGRVADQEGL